MLLSDGDIRAALESGRLTIEPLEDPDVQIQPASVDLRLGEEFRRFTDDVGVLDPTDDASLDGATEVFTPDDDGYVLEPDEFILGTTRERVEVPSNLQGHVEGRSSVGRLGVAIHVTAGIIDSGYRGEITLEIRNLGEAPVRLVPGMRIGQIEFEVLSSEVERPYGSERGSKYQEQSGPTPSRMPADSEVD